MRQDEKEDQGLITDQTVPFFSSYLVPTPYLRSRQREWSSSISFWLLSLHHPLDPDDNGRKKEKKRQHR